MAFTITNHHAEGVQVLALTGRLVLGDGTGALRAAVDRALSGGEGVLLDLGGLTYMDSAGLGEMVGAHASASTKGQKLKLLRPQPRIGSMLQITKLYTTFEVFQEEAAALASFASSAE